MYISRNLQQNRKILNLNLQKSTDQKPGSYDRFHSTMSADHMTVTVLSGQLTETGWSPAYDLSMGDALILFYGRM